MKIMENNLNSIHIFKTNIKELTLSSFIYQLLTNHSDIQKWSIDLEDIDCVLRVVSETLKSEEIIKLIKATGYECQELA